MMIPKRKDVAFIINDRTRACKYFGLIEYFNKNDSTKTINSSRTIITK